MEERKEEICNPTKNVHIYRTTRRTSGRKEEREKSIADGLGCVINEQNEDSIEEEKEDDKKKYRLFTFSVFFISPSLYDCNTYAIRKYLCISRYKEVLKSKG
jgi:hypothetical protein